jgi:hypothetical protein
VTGHDVQRHHRPAALAAFHAKQLFTTDAHSPRQDRTAFRAPPDAMPEVIHPASRYLSFPGHAGDSTYGLCQTGRFPCRLTTAPPSRGA